MSENEEKNYMLVQDECDACKTATHLLKEPIKQNKIVLVDITSDLGLQLAEKHKVESVPTIINVKDTFQQKCFLNGDASKMHCDDGTEKQLIKKKE